MLRIALCVAVLLGGPGWTGASAAREVLVTVEGERTIVLLSRS
jgi:hypothetical protein